VLQRGKPVKGLEKMRGAVNELAQKVETIPYGSQISQTQASA
jgi:hypothetical protein